MTMSRYLTSLQKAIDSASNPVDTDCLLAKKASYLSRLGRYDDAKQIFEQLHTNVFERPHPSSAAWLNCCEAISEYYRDMGPTAHERFRRALALSEGESLRSLRAEIYAWLAHLAFGRYDFSDIYRNLEYAIDLLSNKDSSSMSRVCLVIAEVIHNCGNESLAIRWYQKARNYAAVEGDETLVSAIIFNYAAIGLAMLRQSILSSGKGQEELGIAKLFSASARNFDELVGVDSLSGLTLMSHAQLCSFNGRYLEAAESYSKIISEGEEKSLARVRCWFIADRAWCHLQLGDATAAASDARLARASVTDEVQLDDLAATYSRMAQVSQALGLDLDSKEYLRESEKLWSNFRAMQFEVLGKLGRLCSLVEEVEFARG